MYWSHSSTPISSASPILAWAEAFAAAFCALASASSSALACSFVSHPMRRMAIQIILRISIPRCGGDIHPQESPHDFFGAGHAVAGQQVDGRVSRPFHQMMIADDVPETETQGSRLPGAEEFAGAAKLKIALRHLESVPRLREDLQAILLQVGDQNAIRGPRAAAHPSAKLMQL